jgi:hypothetical protein
MNIFFIVDSPMVTRKMGRFKKNKKIIVQYEAIKGNPTLTLLKLVIKIREYCFA